MLIRNASIVLEYPVLNVSVSMGFSSIFVHSLCVGLQKAAGPECRGCQSVAIFSQDSQRYFDLRYDLFYYDKRKIMFSTPYRFCS